MSLATALIAVAAVLLVAFGIFQRNVVLLAAGLLVAALLLIPRLQ